MSEEQTVSRPNLRPARLSAVVAVGSTLLAVAFLAVSLRAVVFAMVGTLLVGIGLVQASEGKILVGNAGVFAGLVIVGVLGASTSRVLAVASLLVISVGASQNAISLGRTVGRDSPTTRVELVTLVALVVATAVASGIGYGAMVLLDGGSVLVSIALTVGVLALVAAILRTLDRA